MHWRPIATVPQDVPVLLFGNNRYFVGWHEEFGFVVDTGYPIPESAPFPPMYWMPLPKSPTAVGLSLRARVLGWLSRCRGHKGIFNQLYLRRLALDTLDALKSLGAEK